MSDAAREAIARAAARIGERDVTKIFAWWPHRGADGQDGRIYMEKINESMLFDLKATPAAKPVTRPEPLAQG
jgi:hypothetical protein